MRLHVERIGPLAALILLGGCLGLGSGGSRPADSQTAARTGPAADYPMVIGEAYAIGDITHTPADKLNYDAVGRASVSGEGAGGVSAAHQTLPLRSMGVSKEQHGVRNDFT